MGLVKGSLETEEEQTVNTLYQDLMTLKETFLASLNGEQINLAELFDEKIDETVDDIHKYILHKGIRGNLFAVHF